MIIFLLSFHHCKEKFDFVYFPRVYRQKNRPYVFIHSWNIFNCYDRDEKIIHSTYFDSRFWDRFSWNSLSDGVIEFFTVFAHMFLSTRIYITKFQHGSGISWGKKKEIGIINQVAIRGQLIRFTREEVLKNSFIMRIFYPYWFPRFIKGKRARTIYR